MPAGRLLRTLFSKVRFYPKIALGPVTIDGVIVAEGEDIARTGILRIEAGDYDLDSLRLVVNGSVWLPTSRGSNYLQFVVQSDGDFVIYSDYKQLFSFSNSVTSEYPSWMNGVVRARISSMSGGDDYGLSSSEQSSDNFYLNYSRKVDSNYPYYVVIFEFVSDADLSQFSVEGGEITSSRQGARNVVVHIQPTTLNSQIFLKYGELILFVAPV